MGGLPWDSGVKLAGFSRGGLPYGMVAKLACLFSGVEVAFSASSKLSCQGFLNQTARKSTMHGYMLQLAAA